MFPLKTVDTNPVFPPRESRALPERLIAGETMTYRAGDSFVMKPGFTGIWKTIETVRKIYVTVG